MAIGYYNFSPIQQGNQQVINSMAGLGQQISSAIETHAATESAKAMLPMLQQQYQAGMQRISAGDPNGMSDIYNASMTASQNPLLAPMAKNALSTAQSANINVQHMLRTQAAQQGMMDRYGMRYGQEAQSRPMTAYQQEQVEKNASTAKNTQIDEYGALYSGDPTNNVDGIGTLSSKIRESIEKGKAPDAKDIQNFANMYGVYKQKQSAYGKYAVTNPQIESAFSQVQKQVPALTNLVKKEQAKGTGKWRGNTDPNTVNLLNQDIQEIESMGGLPSVQGGTGPVIPSSAIQFLQKNPNTANQFDELFGKGAAQQILKPQSSVDMGMGADVAQQEEETEDTESPSI